VSSYDVSGLSREVPSVPSPLELAPDSKDELDPELLALPDPPRRERTLTVVVLGFAAVLSLAMVFTLRRDVAYALATRTPAGVGELRTASGETLAANENRLVRADGMLGAAGGIRYERPFLDDTFRTLAVAGREDVWVDVRVPAGHQTLPIKRRKTVGKDANPPAGCVRRASLGADGVDLGRSLCLVALGEGIDVWGAALGAARRDDRSKTRERVDADLRQRPGRCGAGLPVRVPCLVSSRM